MSDVIRARAQRIDGLRSLVTVGDHPVVVDPSPEEGGTGTGMECSPVIRRGHRGLHRGLHRQFVSPPPHPVDPAGGGVDRARPERPAPGRRDGGGGPYGA